MRHIKTYQYDKCTQRDNMDSEGLKNLLLPAPNMCCTILYMYMLVTAVSICVPWQTQVQYHQPARPSRSEKLAYTQSTPKEC